MFVGCELEMPRVSAVWLMGGMSGQVERKKSMVSNDVDLLGSDFVSVGYRQSHVFRRLKKGRIGCSSNSSARGRKHRRRANNQMNGRNLKAGAQVV